MYNVVNIVILSMLLVTPAALHIQLQRIRSGFDTRDRHLNKTRVARCSVEDVDLPISHIFFLIGNHEIPVPMEPMVSNRQSYKATLSVIPIASYDKRWVSCLIKVNGTIITSDSSFPLDVKYFPSSIKLEILNAFNYENKWIINEGDQYVIRCNPNGNPKPRFQIMYTLYNVELFGHTKIAYDYGAYKF